MKQNKAKQEEGVKRLDSGVIDVEYYMQNARKLRSQSYWSICKKVIKKWGKSKRSTPST